MLVIPNVPFDGISMYIYFDFMVIEAICVYGKLCYGVKLKADDIFICLIYFTISFKVATNHCLSSTEGLG